MAARAIENTFALSEEAFAKLGRGEQIAVAKNAIAAAGELDASLQQALQSTVKQYHRALQYINAIEAGDEERERARLENSGIMEELEKERDEREKAEQTASKERAANGDAPTLSNGDAAAAAEPAEGENQEERDRATTATAATGAASKTSVGSAGTTIREKEDADAREIMSIASAYFTRQRWLKERMIEFQMDENLPPKLPETLQQDCKSIVNKAESLGYNFKASLLSVDVDKLQGDVSSATGKLKKQLTVGLEQVTSAAGGVAATATAAVSGAAVSGTGTGTGSDGLTSNLNAVTGNLQKGLDVVTQQAESGFTSAHAGAKALGQKLGDGMGEAGNHLQGALGTTGQQVTALGSQLGAGATSLWGGLTSGVTQGMSTLTAKTGAVAGSPGTATAATAGAGVAVGATVGLGEGESLPVGAAGPGASSNAPSGLAGGGGVASTAGSLFGGLGNTLTAVGNQAAAGVEGLAKSLSKDGATTGSATDAPPAATPI